MPQASDHIPLITIICKPFLIRRGYIGRYEDSEEYSDASLALVRASHKFEPDRGVEFSTYAAQSMRNEIRLGYKIRRKIQLGESDLLKKAEEIIEKDTLFSAQLGIEEVDWERWILPKLNEKLNELSDLEKLILQNRMKDVTCRVIAEQLGYSRQYVNKVEQKIYQKLRTAFCSDRSEEISSY